MLDQTTFYLKPDDPRLELERALQLAALRAFHDLAVRHGLTYYLAYGTLLGAIRHGGYIPWDDDLDLMMPRADFERMTQLAATELDNTRFFFQTTENDPLYPGPFAKVRCHHSLVQEAVSIKGKFHEGVYLDVFPLDVGPETPEEQKRRGTRYLFWHLSLRRKIQGYRPERFPVKVLTAMGRLFTVEQLKARRHAVMTRDNDRPNPSVVAAYPGAAADMRDCYMSAAPLGDGIPYLFDGVETRIPTDADRHLTELFGDYMTLPPEDQRVGHHLRELWIDETFWAEEIRAYRARTREATL